MKYFIWIIILSSVIFINCKEEKKTPVNEVKSDITLKVDSVKINYLISKIPSLKKIERFLGKAPYPEGYNPNAGWIFDAELGWILQDAIRYDGIDNSTTFYHYEKSGARKRTNFPKQKARIHAYGNSFTHCYQVNDGESWEEYLAGHLCEPVENFGVGGYSVYQAFLRMKRIEKTHPGKYVIFNIWDDDHFRNLDSWWSIRHSKKGFCSFTMPYQKVNIKKNIIIEMPNKCQSSEDVYKLSDIDWLFKEFKDDPILKLMLAIGNNDSPQEHLAIDTHTIFGLPHKQVDKAELENDLRTSYTKAAIFSTIKILDMLNGYIKSHDKKLLVILSYSKGNLGRYLSGEKPFDQELLDYLKNQDYPYLDLRQLHSEEFKKYNLDVNKYLEQYYIGGGHHNPAGNFFCAMAIKDTVINWLQPKPMSYLNAKRLYESID